VKFVAPVYTNIEFVQSVKFVAPVYTNIEFVQSVKFVAPESYLEG